MNGAKSGHAAGTRYVTVQSAAGARVAVHRHDSVAASTPPVGEAIRNLEFGGRRHSLAAIICYPERKWDTMFRPGVIGWK